MNIARENKSLTLTIPAGTALSDTLDFDDLAGGVLTMPPLWTPASIAFKVRCPVTGAFLPLYDDLGVLVQVTGPTVDRAYKLPDPLFGAHAVQLWSQNGAGVDVPQALARPIGLLLKG